MAAWLDMRSYTHTIAGVMELYEQLTPTKVYTVHTTLINNTSRRHVQDVWQISWVSRACASGVLCFELV